MSTNTSPPGPPAAPNSVSGHQDPAGEAPWAMQLAVRVEKDAVPTHEAVCEAAARAVVLLLNHPDTLDGPWTAAVDRWTDGRIRKVVRRARGAKWDTTAELDHVTVTHRGAQVRAFVPGPTDKVPTQLAKLQVSGLDLEHHPDPDPDSAAVPAESSSPQDAARHPTLTLEMALTPTVTLSTGKAAAQCGHAAQIAARTLPAADLAHWVAAGAPVRLVTLDAEQWHAHEDAAAVSVTDAGFTEIAPGTRTTLAWWVTA